MGTKQFDSATDLITFTRASGGTALRKVSYGNELVTNGDFSSGTTGWVDGTTYSGALDASSGKLLITTDSSSGYGSAIQGVPLVVGKAYRLTGSRRAVSGGNPAIGVSNSAGTVQVVLLSGSASTVTNDFSVTFVASSTLSLCLFNQSPTNGNSSEFDNISVKEALYDQPDGTLQLFNSPANVPRIEYNADGTVKGLLIEEARTNLVTYSQDFSNASWAAVRTASLALDSVGPDGESNSAVKLLDNSAGGTGTVYVRDTVTVSTSTTYTASVYAKADQLSQIVLFANAFTTPANNGFVFDLSNGTYSVYSGTPAITAEMQSVDNGWYRCSITFTTDTTDTSGEIQIYLYESGSVSVPLDGTSSVLLYGAQLEAGSFPTSYIPTTGSTATRAADFAQIPTSAFGYNNDKGSLVIDVLTPVVDQFMSLAYFNTSSFYDSRGFFKSGTGFNATGSYYAFQTHDGATTTLTLTQQTQAEYAKLGLSYGNNEKAVRDGGNVQSGTSRYPNPTRLHLGSRDSVYQSQCWIKSIQYYPRRLTDTQLQELTT